jgi:hypothetical protein
MDKIHLFRQYAWEILGLEDVPVSPDPMFLQDYMANPEKGFTIEMFRSATTKCVAVGTRQPGVDPTIDDSIQYSHVKLDRDTTIVLDNNQMMEE